MDDPDSGGDSRGVRRWNLALLVALSGMAFGCPQDVRALVDGGVDGGGADASVGADGAATIDGGDRFDAGRAADAGPIADAAPIADAGPVADAGDPGDAGPGPDAGFAPNEPCTPIVLPCLDRAAPEVLSVPDEMSWTQAVDTVQSNQTIQVRGLRIGAGIRVPPAVTLHGCEGASIVGAIGFEGLGGRVQGFEVAGSINANQTGTYVVSHNRFIDGMTTEAGVSARSIDALVSAQVNMIVEQNTFVGRNKCAEAATRYDTMRHEVSIQIRNNTFSGCETAIVISEAGLVGEIDATIEHNTFHQFSDAVALYSVAQPITLTANLFADGTRAVAGTSPFYLEYALVDNVETPSQIPPFSGAFAQGVAGFVDAAAGDFRLTDASDALDLVPEGGSSVSYDVVGCPRPVGYLSSTPQSDIGAFEAQR